MDLPTLHPTPSGIGSICPCFTLSVSYAHITSSTRFLTASLVIRLARWNSIRLPASHAPRLGGCSPGRPQGDWVHNHGPRSGSLSLRGSGGGHTELDGGLADTARDGCAYRQPDECGHVARRSGSRQGLQTPFADDGERWPGVEAAGRREGNQPSDRALVERHQALQGEADTWLLHRRAARLAELGAERSGNGRGARSDCSTHLRGARLAGERGRCRRRRFC